MGEAWETISKPSSMWEILLKAQILRMSGVAISFIWKAPYVYDYPC
jgi:hypothetical protein